MPIAIAVGRRSVLLAATALMLLSASLCAGAANYDWHLASRLLLGLAAGQSEALVPMITQVNPPSPFLLVPNLQHSQMLSRIRDHVA